MVWDAAGARSALVEEPTKRGDLHVQIAIFDDRSGPYGSDEIIPRHELRCSTNQHAENVERARADRNRHETAALVAPEQRAGLPVETEGLEQEDAVHGERPHPVAHPDVSKFIEIYNFLFDSHSPLLAREVRSGRSAVASSRLVSPKGEST